LTRFIVSNAAHRPLQDACYTPAWRYSILIRVDANSIETLPLAFGRFDHAQTCFTSSVEDDICPVSELLICLALALAHVVPVTV
jgi:hypothetical protein